MDLTKHAQTWRSRSLRLAAFLDRLQPLEQTLLVVTACIVGLLAALGILAFRWLISLFHAVFLVPGGQAAALPGALRTVLAPALGGLIVGLLVHFLLSGQRGHGVAGLMEAVAVGRGRLSLRATGIRALGASITLGSGGSAGPEDPSVQIGSTVGSVIGQTLRLSEDRVRTLLAAGAAGGISSAFNAPIAGVFFALEIILGDFSTSAFGIVVLSSVVSALVSQAVVGSQPAFAVPEYTLRSPFELIFYLILGILAALVSVAYIQAMHRVTAVFERATAPDVIKPAIGGLIVGALALGFPQVLGIGYETIEQVLQGTPFGVWLLVALVAAKLVATATTLGSGGLGGMFAPSLFLGAMLGSALGQGVGQLFPGLAAPPSAYALVGMAAVLAGAVRAPITAIILLFEMTNDYRIILPLMFATVVSVFLSEHWHRESVYTLWLANRGVRLDRGRDIDVMQAVQVAEVMTTEVDTVPWDMSLPELIVQFDRTHHHGFPVLDANGELYGIVSIGDLQQAMQRPDADKLRVADMCTTSLVTLTPEEPMWAALKKMAPRDLSRLPVVDPDNPKRLVGLLRRPDLVKAYNVAIMRRIDAQHRHARLRLGPIAGTEFLEAEVGPGSPVAGKAIHDIPLPCDCVFVSIRRGRMVLLPHGDTVIQAHDKVIAIAQRGSVEALREVLSGEPAGVADE